MRSMIDWLSEFYGPKRNPYLRLGEADRQKLGMRTAFVIVAVVAVFTIWRLLRGGAH
jgi:hypothetical protein